MKSNHSDSNVKVQGHAKGMADIQGACLCRGFSAALERAPFEPGIFLRSNSQPSRSKGSLTSLAAIGAIISAPLTSEAALQSCGA